MKNLKSKVIMSAIVLVFALIATIGSTYAWFTISNQVNVTSFNVDVQSSEALLMRVWDGEVYTGGEYGTYQTADNGSNPYWTLDDFANTVAITNSSQYDTEIAAALFTPVTALKGEDSTTTAGKFLTDYDDVDFTGLRVPTTNFLTDFATYGRELTTANYNSANGGYIQLKFWLLRPAGTSQNVRFEYTITDNNAAEDYENAIFIGVLGDGNQFIYGDNLDLTFSWSGSMPGIATGGDIGLNSIATNSVLGGPVQLLTVAGDAGADFTAHLGEATSNVLVLGDANIPEIVTIYIWAEGWDSDAGNAIMGASFDITFTFTLVA